MSARVIVGLELRQLWRSPPFVYGLGLLCVAFIFAVYHAHTIIERQRAAIATSDSLQREQHRAILSMQPRDANAGDQLYYLFFHTVHEPSAWAPIALGQRDVQPFNLKVRLLALHGQLYDNDVVSPLLASFGSFDLTFVLVFIVPLFVIALTHNVSASERELGTWDLIRSQPASTLRLLALKLAIRTGVVLVPVVLVMVVSAWALALQADFRLVATLFLVVSYVLAWAGAALMVVAWKRSSSVSLLVLLGLWTVGCILGPALVNVVAGLRYPVPEALELTLRQRQGYHDAWDRPVAETMRRFYERYPEWRDTPVPADRYSNAWYYAMQQRGDEEAEAAAATYADTLARRTAWTRRALVLFPPALLQSAMNAIARTDLESHLAYQASVGSYHEELKRYFFPVIFNDLSIGQVEWHGAPGHRFNDDRSVPLWVGRDGVTLGAFAALVVAAGAVARWRSREHAG
jgi:ABC-2 type transport system permease protein